MKSVTRFYLQQVRKSGTEDIANSGSKEEILRLFKRSCEDYPKDTFQVSMKETFISVIAKSEDHRQATMEFLKEIS